MSASPQQASNDLQQRILAAWQHQIDFYGKVVDQNSNPVTGAQITFHWMETPDNAGSRSSNTLSDSQGLFSLHGAKGPSLSMTLSKDGYYSSHHGRMGFNYALGPDPISPDPQNPIVFILQKKGSGEQLNSLTRNYLVSPAGIPLSVDLVSGATNASLGGDFIVRCWTQNQGKRSNEKYDWHCVISIPGGGLVSTTEEFPFLAPEGGYQPSIDINMPADTKGWQSQADLKFYFHLANGHYGRMTFSMVAGGQHFCMIDSVLNPRGSRDLEPTN